MHILGAEGYSKHLHPSLSCHCLTALQRAFCYTNYVTDSQPNNRSLFVGTDTSVTLGELRRARVQAARLVKRYGPIYWPVVERLQAEITSRESREALLSSLLDG